MSDKLIVLDFIVKKEYNRNINWRLFIMLVWLLVVLYFGPSNQPMVAVEMFSTEANCKAAIVDVTAEALQHSITDASIVCTPHTIGKLS